MSFSGDIRNGIDNIQAENEKIIKLSAIELFSRLIKQSPVGNPSLWMSKPPKGYTGGTFRNNWYLTFRTPSTQKNRGPGSESLNEISNIARVSSDKYILTNNLPYAERIENGWSKQAPTGLVRKNEKKWSTIVKQISRKVRK